MHTSACTVKSWRWFCSGAVLEIPMFALLPVTLKAWIVIHVPWRKISSTHSWHINMTHARSYGPTASSQKPSEEWTTITSWPRYEFAHPWPSQPAQGRRGGCSSVLGGPMLPGPTCSPVTSQACGHSVGSIVGSAQFSGLASGPKV